MYYYKKEGKNIVKYEVLIDKEKLTKLRYEIIEMCSYIKHIRDRVTDRMRPNKFDYEHIRNYAEEYIGRIEYNDFYSMPEDEYLVEYDYYIHSPLIQLIDDLLNGNTNSIEKIKKYKEEIKDEEKYILEEQQEIIKKLNSMIETNKEKQIRLLNENQEKLLEYYKEKELNKNQVSSNKYKNKVLGCISLKEKETISCKIVLEVMNFFIDSNDKIIDNELNKVLKLNL